MPQLPKVAVIGAGSSGIAGLKTMLDAGLDVTCYEKSDRVGGNWVYHNANGMSSAYRSLHINTSRDRMAYRDFPMPRDYPDFPHHRQIARYFDAYVDHFGIRPNIRFRTGVAHARRLPDRTWRLGLDTGGTALYDALVVANGHHWDPRWPQPPIPGSESFGGVQMHSHHYDVPDVMRDKDVVVVGMGNSAMDIAVEASQVARTVYLAARRGAYVLPKYRAGRPIDASRRQLLMIEMLPFPVRSRVLSRLHRSAVGTMQAYGLPEPDHPIGAEHPTISDTILSRITHGRIQPRPNIARLDGADVVFADGTRAHADVVVYATGYNVTFPFFDPEFISAPGNVLDLYRRVFHPDIPGVYFLALLQPLGATMPLAEAQGRWLGEFLRGRYVLPPRERMLADVRRDRETVERRYVRSTRHTMQVDFDLYLWRLDREIKQGRQRAARAGYPLPLPGAVAAAEAAGAHERPVQRTSYTEAVK